MECVPLQKSRPSAIKLFRLRHGNPIKGLKHGSCILKAVRIIMGSRPEMDKMDLKNPKMTFNLFNDLYAVNSE